MVQGLFEEFGGGRRVDADWPLIPYADSLLKYGTDKPDLRNPIEMQVVSEHFRGSGFAIFAKLLEQEGTEVRAIPAPTGGSRKFADRMNAFAQKRGPAGHGLYLLAQGRGRVGIEAAGPIAKAIGAGEDRGDPRAAGSGRGRRGLLPRRQARAVRGGRGPGAHRDRRASWG